MFEYIRDKLLPTLERTSTETLRSNLTLNHIYLCIFAVYIFDLYLRLSETRFAIFRRFPLKYKNARVFIIFFIPSLPCAHL